MALCMLLALLLLVSRASSISACEDFADVVVELRDYAKEYTRPRHYAGYQQRASSYNIDLEDTLQLRTVACVLVEDDMSTFSRFLGLDELHAMKLAAWIEGLDPDIIAEEIERVEHVVGIYQRAKEFVAATWFPDFPLDLGVEEAVDLVTAAGAESLNRLLGINAPGSEAGIRQLATALSEASTVEEFSYLTYNKYDPALREIDARLQDVSDTYDRLVLQPPLLAKLREALIKYNIPQKFFDD